MVYVITSSASSLHDPCPSNMGIGYGVFNDTTFVICDPSFYKDSHSNDLALELGLGLGLGIIGLVGIIIIIIFISSHTDCCKKGFRHMTLPIPLTPEESVRYYLSSNNLNDFMSGNLTIELKKTLVNIRKQRGGPLTEFVKYATDCGNISLATWIENITYTTLQDERIV